MSCLGLFLWIITDKLLGASTCLIHDKCMEDLGKFTQVDEFHVYRSLDEAEAACRGAKDDYLCVASSPQCRNFSEMAKFSPLLRGSFTLLRDFCGYRSKRRPCCALRSAYLEHSSCYEEVIEELNDCNAKYRHSLDAILTIQGEEEQNRQRFCSLKWFGKCVKTATQSYCGKVAAEVIKSYAKKAGKPDKTFVQDNGECRGNLYGYESERTNFCHEKRFQKCSIYIIFLREYLVEDRLTDEERFLSICTGIHDSLECLYQAVKRCFFTRQAQDIVERVLENEIENNACLVKENVLQRYKGKMYCLTRNVEELSYCQQELEIPTSYVDTLSVSQQKQHFCSFLKKVQRCWTMKASETCGVVGKEVMNDIITMASKVFHLSCDMQNN